MFEDLNPKGKWVKKNELCTKIKKKKRRKKLVGLYCYTFEEGYIAQQFFKKDLTWEDFGVFMGELINLVKVKFEKKSFVFFLDNLAAHRKFFRQKNF